MTYGESIKAGFRIVNSRWQLVAINASLLILNCALLLVMVLLPLGIAFVVFGLDLTVIPEAERILDVLKDPVDFLSRYMGIVLIVVTSFLLYLLSISLMGLFVFGGTAGVIGRSMTAPSERFSMGLFFSEARRLFFPVMWFSALMGVLFLLFTFVFGILGGVMTAVVSEARSQDSTLALFLGIFFTLVTVLVAAILIAMILAITVYGMATLVFKREGAFRTFRSTSAFLWRNAEAFWLYVLLLIGYVVGIVLLMFLSYPFNLIPIIGTIISFPMKLVSYVAQSYLGLVVTATVFFYYFRTEMKETGEDVREPEETRAGDLRTGDSTSQGDTSAGSDPGPDVLPPRTETP